VPDPRLDAIAAVAAEAAALGLRRQTEGFRRWEKSPGNPVCDIDLELDALIAERLRAIDPEAGWLSEETADSAERLTRVRVWVVDPIDGTRDYLRGRSGWAVSIALVEGGRSVLGVLDAPGRAERWAASLGGGATCNGVAVHCSDRTALSGARVPADTIPKADADLIPVPRPNSIALRIAMVASGEADLVATLRWGHEWDIAAAALIAHEAGATVSDALGQPIRYNSTKAEAFGLMISAPGIHQAAVERLGDRARAARVR
jgi:myo-inositol-1(or 4)-monophosphatase